MSNWLLHCNYYYHFVLDIRLRGWSSVRGGLEIPITARLGVRSPQRYSESKTYPKKSGVKFQFNGHSQEKSHKHPCTFSKRELYFWFFCLKIISFLTNDIMKEFSNIFLLQINSEDYVLHDRMLTCHPSWVKYHLVRLVKCTTIKTKDKKRKQNFSLMKTFGIYGTHKYKRR